jgi:hypothetical protein
MVRSETVAQQAADVRTAAGRADALRAAVSRLRRELAAYPAELPDRAVGEEGLALIDAAAARGAPDPGRLRGSLLLVAAAFGSVSVLAPALAGLRRAIDACDVLDPDPQRPRNPSDGDTCRARGAVGEAGPRGD